MGGYTLFILLRGKHTHFVFVLWRSTNCLAHHHRVCALAPTMMMACALTPLWGIRDETTDSTAEKTVSVSSGKTSKGNWRDCARLARKKPVATHSLAHSLTQSAQTVFQSGQTIQICPSSHGPACLSTLKALY